MRKDTFAEYNPIVSFLYFAFMLGFTMVLRHPSAQAISIACAFCYSLFGDSLRKTASALRAGLLLLLITALINPVFNHAGVTTLFYLKNGNPVTLESLLYGLSAGAMLLCALLWFRSFNRVMTSDKLVYLFGRLIPALSLVLSMALRFVPRFTEQFKKVSEAQAALGRDTENGSLFRRLKNALAVFSAVVTWSLESSVETADIMKGRGYGLARRSSFSIYKFDSRDRLAVIFILLCGAVVFAGIAANGFAFQYFPVIRCVRATPITVGIQVIYLCLCALPIAINLSEAKKWTVLRSKI